MKTKIASKATVPNAIWLVLAVVLFGAGTPLLKLLVTRGGHFGDVLVNAISYCNVLFVGNLLSALLVVLYYGSRRTLESFRSLTRAEVWLALANTILANVIAPALVITALELSSVTVVVLLLQTDIVFLALAGRLIYGDNVSRWQWRGYSLIAVGSVFTAILFPGQAGAGVWLYVIMAAACRAMGNVLARSRLAQEEKLPAFLCLRNLVGALCFFALAILMFGPGHFAEAFAPGLWELMIVYAAVIVVLAQLSWYRALATLPGSTIAIGWTMTPVVSLLTAFFLLHESPALPQWISTIFILGGLVLAQIKTPSLKQPQLLPGGQRALTGSA